MCTGKNAGESLTSAANPIGSSTKEEGKIPVDFSKFQVLSKSLTAPVRAKKACHNSLGALIEQHRKVHMTVDSVVIGSKLLYEFC